nr:NADH dehydrogenase subunit 6 [Odontocerum albicorne]
MFMMISIFLISLCFMETPLMINLTLIAQILLVSMIVGILNKNFWFSYILFLIFIGGLMILFLYVTSLINNKLKFNQIKNLILKLTLMILISIMIFMNFEMITLNFFENMDLTSFNLWNKIVLNNFNDLNIILSKIYNKSSLMMSFILMNYLLLTMIICIKIINFHKGPLRTKFN